MILAGCSNKKLTNQSEMTTEIEPSTAPSVLDRDQSVYFNCITTDGLSAYSLTQVLYEQPEIKKSIIFEYSIYNNYELIKSAFVSDKVNIAILPFKLATDLLLEFDNYKLLGVVKGENHILVGISSYVELYGKEIVIFDPSGFDGAFMTTIERIQYETNLLGINYGEDYTVKIVKTIEEMNSLKESQVGLIDFHTLNLEMFKVFKDSNLFVEIDESEDFQIAVLMKDSIIDIYPDVATSFIEVYYRSCLWLSAYPERAKAYATQLNLTKLLYEDKTFYYFDASDEQKTLENLLLVIGYNTLESQKIMNLIYESN